MSLGDGTKPWLEKEVIRSKVERSELDQQVWWETT